MSTRSWLRHLLRAHLLDFGGALQHDESWHGRDAELLRHGGDLIDVDLEELRESSSKHFRSASRRPGMREVAEPCFTATPWSTSKGWTARKGGLDFVAHLNSPSILSRQFLVDRSDSLAGSAPHGMKVNHRDGVLVGGERVELRERVDDRDRHGGRNGRRGLGERRERVWSRCGCSLAVSKASKHEWKRLDSWMTTERSIKWSMCSLASLPSSKPCI